MNEKEITEAFWADKNEQMEEGNDNIKYPSSMSNEQFGKILASRFIDWVDAEMREAIEAGWEFSDIQQLEPASLSLKAALFDAGDNVLWEEYGNNKS